MTPRQHIPYIAAILLVAVVLLMPAGCVGRKSGTSNIEHRTSNIEPANLQPGVRDKYLFAAMQVKPLRTPHSALRTPSSPTVKLAWTAEVFCGYRIWQSSDLMTWTVAQEGPRPLHEWTFTNTVTGPYTQSFYKLELY